jgi:hypothetical protein
MLKVEKVISSFSLDEKEAKIIREVIFRNRNS